MKKRLQFVVLLVVIALLMTACGNNASESNPTDSGQTTVSAKREAATPAEFRKALNEVGYYEAEELVNKLGGGSVGDRYDKR